MKGDDNVKKFLITLLAAVFLIGMIGCSSDDVNPLDVCKEAWQDLAAKEYVHFTVEQNYAASDGSYTHTENQERWYNEENWLQVSKTDSAEVWLLQSEGTQYSLYPNGDANWQTVDNPTSLAPIWKSKSWDSLEAECLSANETGNGLEVVCVVKDTEIQNCQYTFVFDNESNLISITVSGTTSMTEDVAVNAEFKHIIHNTDETEIESKIKEVVADK